MKTVKGIYNGEKVTLEENVKVEHDVEVVVTFPEDERLVEDRNTHKEFQWEKSRKLTKSFKGSIVDILFEERRESK